jgi:hypothetical protein
MTDPMPMWAESQFGEPARAKLMPCKRSSRLSERVERECVSRGIALSRLDP